MKITARSRYARNVLGYDYERRTVCYTFPCDRNLEKEKEWSGFGSFENLSQCEKYQKQ